jgi:hypothetical protein
MQATARLVFFAFLGFFDTAHFKPWVYFERNHRSKATSDGEFAQASQI